MIICTGGKASKHIKRNDFAVMEFNEAGIVRLKHLKTAIMVADITTKPLNGGLLRHMTGRVLNEPLPDYEIQETHKENIEIKQTHKGHKLNVNSLML